MPQMVLPSRIVVVSEPSTFDWQYNADGSGRVRATGSAATAAVAALAFAAGVYVAKKF